MKYSWKNSLVGLAIMAGCATSNVHTPDPKPTPPSHVYSLCEIHKEDEAKIKVCADYLIAGKTLREVTPNGVLEAAKFVTKVNEGLCGDRRGRGFVCYDVAVQGLYDNLEKTIIGLDTNLDGIIDRTEVSAAHNYRK